MHAFFTLILSLFLFSALNHYSAAQMAAFLPDRILAQDRFVGSSAGSIHFFPGIIASESGKEILLLRNEIMPHNLSDNFIMPDLTAARSDIKKSNHQRTSLIATLKEIFRNEGVPDNLVWLVEVESSFNPEAESPAGAVGLFQLMPATAQRFGLQIFPVDDRRAPHKSAKAAAAYLRFLHNEFGCWALALAAYNAGEGRVGRAMRENEARTYREIAPYLPSETRRYVPRVMAIMALREDQARGVPSALFKP